MYSVHHDFPFPVLREQEQELLITIPGIWETS